MKRPRLRAHPHAVASSARDGLFILLRRRPAYAVAVHDLDRLWTAVPHNRDIFYAFPGRFYKLRAYLRGEARFSEGEEPLRVYIEALCERIRRFGLLHHGKPAHWAAQQMHADVLYWDREDPFAPFVVPADLDAPEWHLMEKGILSESESSMRENKIARLSILVDPLTARVALASDARADDHEVWLGFASDDRMWDELTDAALAMAGTWIRETVAELRRQHEAPMVHLNRTYAGDSMVVRRQAEVATLVQHLLDRRPVPPGSPEYDRLRSLAKKIEIDFPRR